MFGLENLGNYDDRMVDRYETSKLTVSTAAVYDSRKPFETAIAHSDYNHGHFIVVEMYDTREASQQGHRRWVETMTKDELPELLRDVGENDSADLVNAFSGGEEWNVYKREATT